MNRLLTLSLVLLVAGCSTSPELTPSLQSETLLGSSALSSPIPSVAPDISNWGSTPTGQSQMPFSLDCSQNPSLAKGPTWNGLTVGVSSLEDVAKVLVPVQGVWNTETGNLLFESYGSNRDWQRVEACFVDLKLSALNVWGTVRLLDNSLDGTLDTWLTRYGNPAKVTWSYDYYARSLIWPEEGLLAVVGAEPADNLRSRTYTLNFILYSPLPAEQLDQSWLANSLPTKGPNHSGDLPPLPTEREDLWDIEH